MVLTTLAHHIDLEWLREAFRRTRKDGATGVDGQTAAEYAVNLDANLALLLERAKGRRRCGVCTYRRAADQRLERWAYQPSKTSCCNVPC